MFQNCICLLCQCNSLTCSTWLQHLEKQLISVRVFFVAFFFTRMLLLKSPYKLYIVLSLVTVKSLKQLYKLLGRHMFMCICFVIISGFHRLVGKPVWKVSV